MNLYSISKTCIIFKISPKTLYEWEDPKPSLRKAIDELLKARYEMLLTIARLSLKKKLEGYTRTEERGVYAQQKQPFQADSI